MAEDGYAVVTEGAEGQEALSGGSHVVVILPVNVWEVAVGATALEAGWNSSGEAEEEEEEEEAAAVLPPAPRLPLGYGCGVGGNVSFAIGCHGGDLMKASNRAAYTQILPR